MTTVGRWPMASVLDSFTYSISLSSSMLQWTNIAICARHNFLDECLVSVPTVFVLGLFRGVKRQNSSNYLSYSLPGP